MALIYPKKYKNDIDLETQDLNRFLLYYIAYYKDSKYNDTMLWHYIKEDFVR
jgi:hypothetical protein